MISLFLMATLVRAANVCTPNHPTGTADLAKAIEARARSADGQVCADADGMSASTEDQNKLLGLIRDRAVDRLRAVKIEPDQAGLGAMRDNVSAMRLFMALGHSTIVPGPNGPRLSPAVELKHPPGFAKVDKLTVQDNERLQRAFADRLQPLKQRLSGGGDAKHVLTEVGAPLQTELRSIGQVGYQDVIAQHSELLFVSAANPTDADLAAAQTAYAKSVRSEIQNLSALPMDAGGDSVGLIFYGPSVEQTLKAHPERCAAFVALRARAERTLAQRQALNTGVGLAAGGACLAAAVVSAGLVGPACFALSLGEFGLAADSARRSFREREVLFGGLMQGASMERYAEKQREAEQYLLAAGLAAGGAVSAVKDVTGLARGLGADAVAASTRRSSIEAAHVEGFREPGLDGTPAGLNNYTPSQLRRKAQILRRDGIDRADRRRLMESGRVGVEDPTAHLRAEDRLRALKGTLKDKQVRGLEDRLAACLKSGKKCDEIYAAIDDAFANENEAWSAKVGLIERQLEDLGLADESLIGKIDDHLKDLAKCREFGGPGCAEVLREASSLLPSSEVRLQPAKQNAPRFVPDSRPVQEVQKLTALRPDQRNSLIEIFRSAAGKSNTRALEIERGGKGGSVETLKVDLNEAITKLLGEDVKVADGGSKAYILSRDGQRRIALDPHGRNITTWEKNPKTGDWEYSFFDRDAQGNFHRKSEPGVYRDKVLGSHFQY